VQDGGDDAEDGVLAREIDVQQIHCLDDIVKILAVRDALGRVQEWYRNGA